jgi:hypothetical protein
VRAATLRRDKAIYFCAARFLATHAAALIVRRSVWPPKPRDALIMQRDGLQGCAPTVLGGAVEPVAFGTATFAVAISAFRKSGYLPRRAVHFTCEPEFDRERKSDDND